MIGRKDERPLRGVVELAAMTDEGLEMAAMAVAGLAADRPPQAG